MAAISRVFAREAAFHVGCTGSRWITGAVEDSGNGEAGFGLGAVHRAQQGLISDMDHVANALYGRDSMKSA
jgi:hypothetical protein